MKTRASPIFGELDDSDFQGDSQRQPSDGRPRSAFLSADYEVPRIKRSSHREEKPTSYVRLEPERRGKKIPVKESEKSTLDHTKEIVLRPRAMQVNLEDIAANLVDLDAEQVAALKKKLEERTKEVSDFIVEKVVIDLLAAKQGLEKAILMARDGLGQEIASVSTEFMQQIATAKGLELTAFILGVDGVPHTNLLLSETAKLLAERTAKGKGTNTVTPEEVTRSVGVARTVTEARQGVHAAPRKGNPNHG